MNRIGIVGRRALLLALLPLPSLALGQDAKPGDGPKEAEAKIDATHAQIKAQIQQEVGRAILESQARVEVAKAQAAKAKAEVDASKAKAKVNLTRSRGFTSTQFYQPKGQAGVNLDPIQVTFGIELADADEALRALLDLPSDLGVVVVTVKPDALGGQAGLKVNDVLTELGDQKAKGVGATRAALLKLGKEAIEVKVIREAKPRIISMVGPQHGTPAEAPDYWIGVPVFPIDATLRSHLPGLNPETGLIAGEVVADSPAAKAGLKKNDILVKLGDKPLKDTGALVAQVQAAADKPTPLEILRAGKPITITITPTKRAPSAVAVNPATTDPFHTYYQLFLPPQVTVQREGKPATSPTGTIELQNLLPQIEAMMTNAKVVDPNAKLEAGLQEVKASVEELRKAIESLKKPSEK